MNYNNRIFRGRSNSKNGDVSDETRFHYQQEGDRLSGKYSGGEIATGNLLGRVYSDGKLEFVYHHLTNDGEMMAGKCVSTPGVESGGKIVLQEKWQWFTGDQSEGASEVEEI